MYTFKQSCYHFSSGMSPKYREMNDIFFSGLIKLLLNKKKNSLIQDILFFICCICLFSYSSLLVTGETGWSPKKSSRFWFCSQSLFIPWFCKYLFSMFALQSYFIHFFYIMNWKWMSILLECMSKAVLSRVFRGLVSRTHLTDKKQ